MRLAIRWARLNFALLLLLSACATPADRETSRILAGTQEAWHTVLTCRRTIGAEQRYQELAIHMPLIDTYTATLRQLSDTGLPNDGEVRLLGLWLGELQTCRRQFAYAAQQHFPTALAILLALWNKEDETFVLLATRRLSWGKATMQLRVHEAEFLAAQTHQALQLAKELNRAKQAEISERLSFFNALTNLAP
jgi:hypothetical protein